MRLDSKKSWRDRQSHAVVNASVTSALRFEPSKADLRAMLADAARNTAEPDERAALSAARQPEVKP